MISYLALFLGLVAPGKSKMVKMRFCQRELKPKDRGLFGKSPKSMQKMIISSHNM
jgi:hypothetical protein